MTDTPGHQPAAARVDHPCEQCGKVHERCVRHNRDGDPCKRWPLQGTTVCKSHGGQLPRVAAAAARNVVEAKARRTLDLLAPEPVTDPLAALSRLAGRVVAWEQVCAERVAALEEIRYTADGVGTEQLRAEVDVFRAALAECRQTLTAIARLDIDSRLARISAAQAAVMERVIDAALRGAGVAGESADRGRAAAAVELRAAAAVEIRVSA